MVTSERFREPAVPNCIDPPEDIPGIETVQPTDHPLYPTSAGPEARMFFERIFYDMIQEWYAIVSFPDIPFDPEAVDQQLVEAGKRVVNRAVEDVTAPVRTVWDLQIQDMAVSDQVPLIQEPWSMTQLAQAALRKYGLSLALFEFRQTFGIVMQSWR